MKKHCLFLYLAVFAGLFNVKADDSPVVHYNFAPSATEGQILDLSDNGYNATLLNGASLRYIDEYPVADLGGANGYIDMGTAIGQLITGLEDFSVAVNIYIDPATTITGNGNFVWTFSTSAACTQTVGKYIAYRVNAQRYAQATGGWDNEKVAIQKGAAATKGSWQHIVYSQSGTTGTIYLNGAVLATGTASYKPKDIGEATLYNWLGRPQFSSDVYLKNTLLSDFRIYNKALSAADVAILCANQSDMNTAMLRQEVIDAKNLLEVENTVRQNLDLPAVIGKNVAVAWSSDKPTVISNAGVVNRPANGQAAEIVTLTAVLSKNNYSETKVFVLTVLPRYTDTEAVAADAAAIHLDNDRCRRLDIYLPTQGTEGSAITWQSGNTDYLSNEGKIVMLPPRGTGNVLVPMTASVRLNEASVTRTFDVCIAEDEGFSAYLFAYFTGNSGNQEAIRFAISRDGYNFKTLNSGNPIISSDTIAAKKGVRDPHILRGDDGYFYMVVTDMKASEGWNSNHGIVLMKSTDLVNWAHSAVDIRTKYPFAPFSACDRAWAPQTIYDPQAGKYMVYFSMRFGSGADVIYYAYANADFTDLEGTPQVLFNHPQAKACIDGDIIYRNGVYNLFFKTEGDGDGIKKAVSDQLTSGYVLQDKYLQQTTSPVEGSCVYKLNNQDKYILMYDVYTSGKYQFTESGDLEIFTIVDASLDFAPRHGTVISITEEEGQRLMQKWGQSIALEIIAPDFNTVRKLYWTKNESASSIFLPVKDQTDISIFAPQFTALPGIGISPAEPQDFTGGAIDYTLTLGSRQRVYHVSAEVNNNPVLDGFYADPQVLYSQKTGKYYIYPTSDGFASWGGYYFKAFSSSDLVDWTDEGVFLDMQQNQVPWANGNAWAPAIVEKQIDGNYKYFFYFSGNAAAGGGKQIGVAVANHPAGPFTAQSAAMLTSSPTGSGQQIDPCIFTDPVSGKTYIYWGNAYLAGAELNDDMLSLKAGTTKVLTPSGGSLSTYAYREGTYVFYREGKYYFMWSVDDTGVANYHVAYGTATSPLGNITVAENPIILIQDAANKIYGTGHNSVLQIPGRDEWYIVYHRINAGYLNNGPGYHREVCIDKLEFNTDGTIRQTTPTRRGVRLSDTNSAIQPVSLSQSSVVYPNPVNDRLIVNGTGYFTLYSLDGKKLKSFCCTGSENNLDVSGISQGMYIGILNTGNNMEQFKILKTK
jgi:GH43 family beta-xylosidase